MAAPTRFLIRKDTDVWVAKGIGFPCVLVPHKMLKDMSIPYPADPGDFNGYMVVGLAKECKDLRPWQIMMLETLMAESTMCAKHDRVGSMSFYALLCLGWNIFATDDEEYPFLVAHTKDVDEVDNEWDVEDMGDGLSVHRIQQSYFMMPGAK